MEVLKELVRGIVLLIILTAFLDMLLPSNKMRPYLKMVMGLFILVSILNPLISALFQSRDLAALSWKPVIAGDSETQSIRQAGAELALKNQEQFLATYAGRLEAQMVSLVRIIEGVGEAEVKVELAEARKFGSYAGIKHIRVTLQNETVPNASAGIRIEPVRIGKEAPATNSVPQREEDLPEQVREQIKETLSRYFNVPPEQIIVNGGSDHE
ncbi:MAG: stage III sporulation protein AF [Clostridia bacterium]|jgi:stage III sporulation protein AF|nr:stage III sporulation protein AF [Clostridia bacterium]